MRLLLWACFFFLPLVPNAATMHAIIVADTHAKMVGVDIGPSVRKDFAHVRKELHNIVANTSLSLNEILLIDDEASSSRLEYELESMECDPDDVLFFYFAGHGYRTEKRAEDPWPYLLFGADQTRVPYAEVIEKLLSKGPRLLITVADACNELVPERLAHPQILITRAGYDFSVDEEIFGEQFGYRRLFEETEGVVLTAAAKAHQFAKNGLMHGALFTNALLQSMHAEAIASESPSWHTILNRAAMMIQDDQEPYYEIIEHQP